MLIDKIPVQGRRNKNKKSLPGSRTRGWYDEHNPLAEVCYTGHYECKYHNHDGGFMTRHLIEYSPKKKVTKKKVVRKAKSKPPTPAPPPEPAKAATIKVATPSPAPSVKAKSPPPAPKIIKVIK